MKTTYLLPNCFKKWGWGLLLLGVPLGILYLLSEEEPAFLSFNVFAVVSDEVLGKEVFFDFLENNIFDEIIGVLIILGSVFVAFSKEKSEDEFIARIRLEALVWATYVNYGVLLLGILFIYEMTFFWVLVFNMFTILFFFIIRYYWALRKLAKQLQDEE
jgi:hypothetical protein